MGDNIEQCFLSFPVFVSNNAVCVFGKYIRKLPKIHSWYCSYAWETTLCVFNSFCRFQIFVRVLFQIVLTVNDAWWLRLMVACHLVVILLQVVCCLDNWNVTRLQLIYVLEISIRVFRLEIVQSYVAAGVNCADKLAPWMFVYHVIRFWCYILLCHTWGLGLSGCFG